MFGCNVRSRGIGGAIIGAPNVFVLASKGTTRPPGLIATYTRSAPPNGVAVGSGTGEPLGTDDGDAAGCDGPVVGGSPGAGGLASGSVAGSTSGTVGDCDDGTTGDGDGGSGIAVLIAGGAVDVGSSGAAVGSSVGVTAVLPEGSGAIDVGPEAVGSPAEALGMGEADTIGGGGVGGEMPGDAEPSGAMDAAGSGGTGDAEACPAAITTVPRKTIA